MSARVHETNVMRYAGPRPIATGPNWTWRCDGICPGLAQHRAGTYPTYYAAHAAAKRHNLLWHPEDR